MIILQFHRSLWNFCATRFEKQPEREREVDDFHR